MAEVKEKNYQEFLEDIEQDKKLRSKFINLYKDEAAIKEVMDKFGSLQVEDKDRVRDENEVKVEELLDELTLNDKVVADTDGNAGEVDNDVDELEEKIYLDSFKEPNLKKDNSKPQKIGKRERDGTNIEEK